MTSIYRCIQYSHSGTVLQHFRGWRATYESDSGTKTQTFGLLDGSADGYDDHCELFNIDEEVMYATIYSDTNDVEGWIFEDYGGNTYDFTANGADFSPRF